MGYWLVWLKRGGVAAAASTVNCSIIDGNCKCNAVHWDAYAIIVVYVLGAESCLNSAVLKLTYRVWLTEQILNGTTSVLRTYLPPPTDLAAATVTVWLVFCVRTLHRFTALIVGHYSSHLFFFVLWRRPLCAVYDGARIVNRTRNSTVILTRTIPYHNAPYRSVHGTYGALRKAASPYACES